MAGLLNNEDEDAVYKVSCEHKCQNLVSFWGSPIAITKIAIPF
jgi:hypothetical protein